MHKLYPFHLHFNKLVVAKVHLAKIRKWPQFQIPPLQKRVKLDSTHLNYECAAFLKGGVWEDRESSLLSVYLNAGYWIASNNFVHLDKRSIYERGMFEEDNLIYLLRTDRKMHRFGCLLCDCLE